MKKQYGLTAQGEALPIDRLPNNRRMPNFAFVLWGDLRKATGSTVARATRCFTHVAG
jgi:hypothetical protein